MFFLYEDPDYYYLAYATLLVLPVAIPSGIIGILLRRIHVILKVIAGAIAGPITAAILIRIMKN